MSNKYDVGEKVVICAGRSQRLSPRDAGLEPFAGKTGTVSNYYWISKPGESFCLYTVRLDPGRKELVLYEDELDPFPG